MWKRNFEVEIIRGGYNVLKWWNLVKIQWKPSSVFLKNMNVSDKGFRLKIADKILNFERFWTGCWLKI